MPSIINFEGKTFRVSYSKAAKVKSILDGGTEPDNDEQAEFVKTVDKIDFSDLIPTVKRSERGLSATLKLCRKGDIDRILVDRDMSGLEKCRAIAGVYKLDKGKERYDIQDDAIQTTEMVDDKKRDTK